MKTIPVQMISIRYNALTGLAWLMFWAFLAFFLGVEFNFWTLESTTAHWWWIASAVLITVRRPFKTVTVTNINLPVASQDPAP